MADPRRYPLAYRFIPRANRTAAELRAEDLGGCDAVILHSILFPADGSRSEQLVSMDGRTGEELSPDEMFKSWAMMTSMLIELLPPGGRRDFLGYVHDVVRDIVLGNPIVDTRALLVKYIAFVSDALASNVDPYPTEHQYPPKPFTDAEWAELQRLAEEAGR